MSSMRPGLASGLDVSQMMDLPLEPATVLQHCCREGARPQGEPCDSTSRAFETDRAVQAPGSELPRSRDKQAPMSTLLRLRPNPVSIGALER